jgi:hypothetical protein
MANWDVIAPAVASSAVGIAAVAAAYLGTRKGLRAGAEAAKVERRYSSQRAWADRAADCYAKGRLLWSKLSGELQLGKSVGFQIRPRSDLEEVGSLYEETTTSLRMTEATASDAETASIVDELHGRLRTMYANNVSAANLLRLPPPLDSSKLEKLEEQAETAEDGSASESGRAGLSVEELFNRFRISIAAAADEPPPAPTHPRARNAWRKIRAAGGWAWRKITAACRSAWRKIRSGANARSESGLPPDS